MRPLLTAAVASLALPLAMAGAALAQQSLLSAATTAPSHEAHTRLSH